MTLEEAIKHCEEVAQEQDKLCKRYDDSSRYAKSYNKDIVSANAKKSLECFECAKEHRQLAEWLGELESYRAILDELKDEITRAHNDLIESENEYGENARYTENDRGYLGGLLHAYEMFGREYEEINADDCSKHS